MEVQTSVSAPVSLCGCGLVVFLHLKDLELCAVAEAEIAHLHPDIGLGAVGGEDHRFLAGGVCKALVIAVVDILGFAEEELTDAVVAGEIKADRVLLAGHQILAQVQEQSGLPHAVADAGVGDRDLIAVHSVAAAHVRGGLLLRVGEEAAQLADAEGDGAALADVAELHPDTKVES